MSNHERVEAEARKLGYLDYEHQDAAYEYTSIREASAFVVGRTVTAEQVEAAAKALDKNFNPDQWPVMAAMFRDYAATALTAAGLLIEGEE